MDIPKTITEAVKIFTSKLDNVFSLDQEKKNELVLIFEKNWNNNRVQNSCKKYKILFDSYLNNLVNYFITYHNYVLELLRVDNNTAWNELVIEIKKQVQNYLLKKNYFGVYGNTDLTEELTQEIGYQLFISLSNYPYDVDLAIWISTIIRNTCSKYLRNLKNNHQVLNTAVLLDEEKQIKLEKENNLYEVEIVVDALKQISPNRREVIILKYFQFLTFEEIAEKLGKSINAIYNLHNKAKKDLQKIINGNSR